MSKSKQRSFTKPGFTIEQVRSHWDAIIDLYDHANEKIGFAHRQRFLHGIAYFQCEQDAKVLNIWSRTGEAIPYLRNRFPKGSIVNYEVSDAMIKLSKQRFPNEKFYHTDLANLELESGSFDAILSLETLEHCPNPYQFICELYRLLNSNGELVLSCPSATAEPVLRLYELFVQNHGEGPHKFPWSWKVKKMLRTAGFKLIEHCGTVFLPLKSDRVAKLDNFFVKILGRTPIGEFGIRQFYYCRKP